MGGQVEVMRFLTPVDRGTGVIYSRVLQCVTARHKIYTSEGVITKNLGVVFS